MRDNHAQAFYNIWGKVDRPEKGCWTWRGKAKGVSGGYHQVVVGYHEETGAGINRIASRFVFEMMYGGPLPKGMEVGHLCHVAACIKPSHLAGMTKVQNERMKDSRRRAEDRRRTMRVVRG